MKRPRNWLVTVATAVLLSFSGWVALSIVGLQAQAAVATTQNQNLADWLERIERKLDSALERRDR